MKYLLLVAIIVAVTGPRASGAAGGDLPEGTGLAGKYPGDLGLGSDPNVILFYDYEAPKSWRKGWQGNMKFYAHTTDKANVFSGSGALEATLKKGKTGNGGQYKLKKPELVLFQRVYLKYPEGFDIGKGAKFHGLAGVGAGKPDWWPQGSAGKRPTGADKIYGIMCLGKRPGSYYYHPHQRGGYGDGGRYGPAFEIGRWHCFEMMLKVNTVGKKDGAIAFWLDGKLEKHVPGLEWRNTDELALNLVLDHTYFNNGPPKDESLFLDNRVVARSYIGPMVAARPKVQKRPEKKPLTEEEAAAKREAEKKGVAAKAAGKLFQMARQAERMGQRGVARRLYMQIVEKYPDTEVAEKAKAKIE